MYLKTSKKGLGVYDYSVLRVSTFLFFFSSTTLHFTTPQTQKRPPVGGAQNQDPVANRAAEPIGLRQKLVLQAADTVVLTGRARGEHGILGGWREHTRVLTWIFLDCGEMDNFYEHIEDILPERAVSILYQMCHGRGFSTPTNQTGPPTNLSTTNQPTKINQTNKPTKN